MTKNRPATLMIIGAACCFAVCIGDFAVTFIIGWFYVDYNFLTQSESYLGTSSSPVAVYMNVWGVFFSLLFVIYAYALRKTIFSKGIWQFIAVSMLIIYGLGEGAGSALFPNDPFGAASSLSSKLHSIFGALGGFAMVIWPFVLLKVFPKKLFPKLNGFSWIVGTTGPILIIVFLLAGKHLIPLKGLWQRLFLLDYYLLMMAVAVEMLDSNFSLKDTK